MKTAKADPVVDNTPPSTRELATLLGGSHAAFVALTQRGSGVTCEWKRYSKKSPWVLKVSQGDRTLLYATPKAGAFEATVVLGERATQAALGGRVSKKLHSSIRAAKPYVEGRPVRVMVRDQADLAGLEELVAVKLNPTGDTTAASSVGRRRGPTRKGSMAELETKQTGASVEEYLDTIEDPRRRADCAAISALMKKVTKFEAKMWGPGIVGFGSYHYRYATGHEGDACLAGFSSRKPEIVVYIAEGFESREKLLRQLGKHRTGKVCIYIKRLSDIDVGVLEKLVTASVAEMRERYPS